MADRSLTSGQVMAILPETPGRIAAATSGLTPGQLRAAPEDGEWSVNGVLAHLRACADVWGGAIARILGEDRPTIRAVNPRRWIDDTDYPEQDFHRSLAAFTAQRADLLALLEPLGADGWSRAAHILGAGPPLEWTVLHYADRLARHERAHVKQIGRTAEAVGDGA
jgi:hypothetical protein